MGFFKDKFKNFGKQKHKTNFKKELFSWTALVYIIIALTAGFLADNLNKPNYGQFLSADMDKNNNVFILSVDESKGKYKITKVGKNSNVKKQISLDKGNATTEYEYSNLKLDSSGNIYVTQRARNIKTAVNDKFRYPITYESVLMYSSNMAFVKEIAKIDFSNTPIPPTSPYIKKIQNMDKNIIIIGEKNGTYDIISATPFEDEEPKKLKSFEIIPPVETSSETDFDYVTDIATISNGRIFYSTKKGEFFATDNKDNFLNYSAILGKNDISLIGLSTDSADNLYFTDALTGTFYKLNTRSISTSSICKLDETKGDNIKISDLKTIQVIDEDDFFAPSKSFDKQFFARFGKENFVTKNIEGKFFPNEILICIGIIILEALLFEAIKFLFRYEIKRIPIAIKITSLILPFFFLTLGITTFINYNDSRSDYISILRNYQNTGAKIMASGVDAAAFSEVTSTNDFMNAKYIKLRTSISEAFSDASNKVGDKSDYMVTYFSKGNKIYSNFSEKFADNSNSFNELKYVNPDMVTNGTTLVDTVLEENEKNTIYEVWNNLKDGKNSIDNRIFKDIRGEISASFAPIKTNNGVVVGFVGNFLDEKIHKKRELNKILTHNISLSIVFAALVAAYIIFITKFSLRPLKKLEEGINSISRGEWNIDLKIRSKDEFADIVQAFNLMSEKISLYTKNLTILNREYLRYTPKNVIKLLGKDKITNVNLFDSKIVPLSTVYITFNISCKENYNFYGEKNLFDILNISYPKIFDIIQKNNGLVHNFDGTAAMFIFEEPQNAMNASLQLKEIFIDEKLKNNMHILLGHDEVLVGVSGNEERRNIILVSDEIIQLTKINSYLKLIYSNHVATESLISQIDTSMLSYRFIGQTANIAENNKNIKLYEFIDTTNPYIRNLYQITKEAFENAVNLYINRDFETARRLFTDVLSTNNHDKVSLHYLMLCNDELKDKNSDKKFTGNIF